MPVSFITNTVAAAAISTASMTVPVASVEPIIVNEPVFVQEQQCNDVAVNYDNGQSGSIVGGIVGGIVGSQIGHDQNTRRIMTGVGAILGAQAGSQYNSQPSVTYRRHCGVSNVQRLVQTVKGYKVTYVVDGVYQSTVMNHHPGSYITVQRNYVVQ